MQARAFSYSGSELDAMSEARNYYKWILRLAGPFIGSKVVEVGAGTGNFAAAMLRQIAVSELMLVEPAGNLFPRLAERFEADGRVKVLQGYLGDCPSLRGVDSVIAINVIEHIHDDAEFLRLAFRALAPGGTVVLFAPALQYLYGSLDHSFEHYRRYSKAQLIRGLTAASFCLEKILYINFIGIFTWLMAGRILRRRTLRPAQVRLYDRWMVPWISKAERLWEPPLGQSLLAIARKSAAF
jgi:SAM-dependent methyltransferase